MLSTELEKTLHRALALAGERNHELGHWCPWFETQKQSAASAERVQFRADDLSVEARFSEQVGECLIGWGRNVT